MPTDLLSGKTETDKGPVDLLESVDTYTDGLSEEDQPEKTEELMTKAIESDMPTDMSFLYEQTKDKSDFLGGMLVFGQELKGLPKDQAMAILKAFAGYEAASVTNKGWMTEVLRKANKDNEAFAQALYERYGDTQVAPFVPIKITDLAGLGENMAFSITSLVSGLGAAAPLMLIPEPTMATKVAAIGLGTVASGKVAYEMATYDIGQAYLEALNEIEPLTPETEREAKEFFAAAAQRYGLWEAIPEAIGNLGFVGILTRPLSGFLSKAIVGKILSKVGALYGTELITEAITQWGQARIEEEAGLREKGEGQISPLTALKEVAPQTFILVSIMGGAGQTAVSIRNKARQSFRKETFGKAVSPEAEAGLEEHLDNITGEQQEMNDQMEANNEKSMEGVPEEEAAIPEKEITEMPEPQEAPPKKPTLKENLQERLGELQDDAAKKAYLKDSLELVEEARGEYVRKIRKYKGDYLKEELAEMPSAYVTKEGGITLDEAMQQLRERGVDIKNEADLVDYLKDLEARRAEIKSEIKALRPKKIVKTEMTRIKERLADIQRGIREGKMQTLKETKAVQSELVGMTKLLDPKDRAKFIAAIKNIQTRQQMEKTLDDLINRMARVREQTQKAKISQSIKKQLTKTKPVKKGDRKVAKYDYESNKAFEDLRGYSKMNQVEAQMALDQMPDEGLNEIDLIKKRMLSLRANGAQASLQIHQKVLDDIKFLKEVGEGAKTLQDFEKAIKRQENVEEALAGMEKVKGGQNVITKIKKGYAKGFGNIDSLFNFMFGAKFTNKYSPEINESNRNTAIYFKTKKVTEAAAEIYNKDILDTLQEMSKEQFELTDTEGLTHKLDRMQVIDIYNSLKNDAIKERYYDAFGETQITSLISKLTEQDLQMGDLLQNEIQEYRKILNERNIEITGRDLGMVENYWPATSEYQPSVYDDYRIQGETPSAMKERAKGKVMPRPVSAWSKFNKHVGEAEHVKHLAREHEQLKRILTNRRVKHQINEKFGEDVYKVTMALLDGVSLNAQTAKIDAISDAYNKALNNWIKAKLFSPSIFLRQLMSVSNYMEVMPSGEWAARYGKAILHPMATFDYMWKNAPFLEARFNKGYKEALARALDDAQKMSRAQNNWAKGLSVLVRMGDISAIIYGGKPYVDHLIEGGMSKKEAFKKFEKATLRAQQSGLTTSLSQFQQNKTVFARILMAFKNTPAQYLRKMGDATIAYHNKDISAAQYAKTMTIYGVIQPTLYVMAGWAYREGFRALGRLFRGGPPPEGDPLWKEILKQMIVNPVTAIPFISDVTNFAVKKAMGMKTFNITSLPMISDVEDAVRSGFKEDVTFDDWVSMVGTPLEIITGAPILAIKRLYRYLVPEKGEKSRSVK